MMGIITFSPAEVSAKSVTLTYANFPPASTFPCVQMERWKEEVEKRTDGAVKIQTFPGGTLLGARNMCDGVVSGIADIGNLAMSYQPGRFPVSEAIDLPLGFTNAKASSMALYDLIEKYNPEEFKDVKIITLFTCPPSNFMTSKPVKTLEDLKGLELRVSGTGVGVIKNLGATPIAMPMSDTPDAIKKGVVKGIVSSMEILKDFNFASYCPYVTRQNMHVVTFAVVMNKDKWNALPDDVKKVIDDLSREQALWTGTYVDDHVEEALEWSKEKYDLKIFTFPKEDRKKIPDLFKPIIDAYIEKTNKAGLDAEKILKDAKSLMRKYGKKYN
jgi:TRAP-type C4-dicarboxylate transport system substrate-binding protein